MLTSTRMTEMYLQTDVTALKIIINVIKMYINITNFSNYSCSIISDFQNAYIFSAIIFLNSIHGHQSTISVSAIFVSYTITNNDHTNTFSLWLNAVCHNNLCLTSLLLIFDPLSPPPFLPVFSSHSSLSPFSLTPHPTPPPHRCSQLCGLTGVMGCVN